MVPVVCRDAPGALSGVCESGVAENVSGDCDGRPVGSVMLHEIGVDVLDGGENGQSGSWENDADHGGEQVVSVSFVKCHPQWGRNVVVDLERRVRSQCPVVG